MAISIGDTGNIIRDFSESLNQIFGGSTNSDSSLKGGDGLFNPRYKGTVSFNPQKWTGNSRQKQARYGFTTLDLQNLRARSEPNPDPARVDSSSYFLDIPPQSIRQKEVFATNISATRKGIIVESEGVVFKDIIIEGTTGVFPGERGGSNAPTSNLLSSPTDGPTAAQGVDPDTGRSRKSGVKTISGYEEFLRLRQYFLQYASSKLSSDGDLFLIFINEKDDQALIVEPLEFDMIRDKSSPMTYQYRIVLKAIGSLNDVFQGLGTGDGDQEDGFLGLLQDVGAISANVSASIQQSRAVINQSVTLLRRFSQALDDTFLNPLRQTQFAMEDLSDGIATVLSLPEILSRNASETALNIRESADQIGQQVGGFSTSSSATSSDRAQAASNFTEQRNLQEQIENDSRVPVPRSFLESAKAQNRSLADNLTDFAALGSDQYNQIKGRTQTVQPEPLKVVSDEEFLLLGSLENVTDALNISLASNTVFAANADIAFQRAREQFANENVPESQQINIRTPDSVREITIQQNDILERIAQREYGDASRWVDIVVLNNLKPPYISSSGGDGVKRPGDRLLIGNR